jgi:N-acetylglucosaminyl-diphospho-decaprenol L-rhamnosyltransferase
VVTAVLVTYNSAACIATCLESLLAQIPGVEIVIVDNASTDQTERVATSTAPEARFLQAGSNIGFGRACNLGADSAHNEKVLFLNPDVTVEAVDEQALANLLQEQPFGLVAPALDGDAQLRLRRDGPWTGDLIHHTIETLRPHEWNASHNRRPGGADEPTWVGGAMLLVDRQEFISVGRFDSRFFLYYEDRDLSRRYRGAGLPPRTTNAMAGHHAGGESSAHDDIRAGPMAWSFLSWVQFLYIHEGERIARRAAWLSLGSMRAIRLVLTGLRVVAPGWTRLRRKARQLDQFFAELADQTANGSGNFCPEALWILDPNRARPTSLREPT